MIALLKKLDGWTRKTLRVLTISIFVALGLLMALNVALRLTNDLSNYLTQKGYASASATVKALIPIVSFHWFDEIVELCFAALVFYGAAALWASRGHFSVGDWISPRLPSERLRAFYKLLTSLISAVFLGVFLWFSFRLAARSTELTTVFQIPKAFLYSCMPISSFIMLMYSVADVWTHARRLFGDKGAYL
ncbi:MAG: TRAP transporter small permease [Synergistaceae bacterium]|jgi:TRAP-type C4-dicarboxylate transport system permease small subunit|nr:TRAP transporter small permease [Synergistaceae bacterium]